MIGPEPRLRGCGTALARPRRGSMMPQILRMVPSAPSAPEAPRIARQSAPTTVWRKQMRKHPSSMMAVLAILMLIVAACSTPAASEPAESEPAASEPAESEAASEAPTVDYKACMVSDVGG